MSLPATPRLAGPYLCNGSVVDFDFGFKVFTEADVRVVHTDALEAETDLVLTTNYTVSLNADQENDPGGTVTTVSTYPSPEKITIVGALIYSQPTVLTNLGGFFPKVIEGALDRLGILIQQVKEEVSRAVKVNVSSSTDPGVLIEELVAESAAAAAAAAAAAVSEVNAATYEANAASSAAAAALVVSSIMWSDVAFKAYVDSPIAVVDGDAGRLFAIDCSGGNVVVNLPVISGLTLTAPWSVAFRKSDNSANILTINRAGADLIDTGTSYVISSQGVGVAMVPDVDPSPDVWTPMQFGISLGVGSVTSTMLENGFITNLPNASPDLADEIPIGDVSDGGNKKKVTASALLALSAGAISDVITQNTNVTLAIGTHDGKLTQTTSGNPVYTFPTAVGNKGKTLVLRNATSSDTGLRLLSNGGTIGGCPAAGATNYIPAYTTIAFESDDTNWNVLWYSGKKIFIFTATGTQYVPPGLYRALGTVVAGGGGSEGGGNGGTSSIGALLSATGGNAGVSTTTHPSVGSPNASKNLLSPPDLYVGASTPFGNGEIKTSFDSSGNSSATGYGPGGMKTGSIESAYTGGACGGWRLRELINTTPGDALTITVGAGGTAGSGGNAGRPGIVIVEYL